MWKIGENGLNIVRGLLIFFQYYNVKFKYDYEL